MGLVHNEFMPLILTPCVVTAEPDKVLNQTKPPGSPGGFFAF
jgi:hypothetical protein